MAVEIADAATVEWPAKKGLRDSISTFNLNFQLSMAAFTSTQYPTFSSNFNNSPVAKHI
jgi:hypothetical protein